MLTVRDVETSAAFYSRVLRMERRTFGEGRVALHAGRFKLNLHPAGSAEIRLVASRVQPGSLDICFVTTTSPAVAWEHLREEGIDIIAGPVTRSGARGPMTSFYFRDPDGNLIEVSSYPPPPARRSDHAVEDESWIESFLEGAPACVIGMLSDGEPALNPNLFVYDRHERIVFFHTAGRGQTRETIEAESGITISVFEMGRLLPGPVVTDYTVEYASVVLYGRAAIVTDTGRIRHAFSLQMAKYFPHHRPGLDSIDFTDDEAARATVYQVRVERWSAKRNEGEPSHDGAARYGWRYFHHPG